MINIAIDGTTSSGKSSIAASLCNLLGFERLNTGEIYRGIACRFKRLGFKKVDSQSIQKLMSDIDIHIEFHAGKQHTIVCGVDETSGLRTEEISLLTSEIAPYKIVRDEVLKIQRDFAAKHNCVMEGRDITTEVLPNADIKFFITASPEIRAMRRYKEFEGKPNAPTYEQVLSDLIERDRRDENREFGRLTIAPDAIVIDTSNLTLEEGVKLCEKYVRQKLKI